MNNQEITENFYREQRKYAAANQVHTANREDFRRNKISVEEYRASLDQLLIATQLYDDAFQATKAPTTKAQITIAVEDGAKPVMLTEAQLGLLKACTAAQQQLLSEYGEGPTVHQQTSREQINECKELFEIFTAAQFVFIDERQEAGTK